MKPIQASSINQLRGAMTANTVFSTLSAGTFLLAAPAVATTVGITAIEIRALGVGLLLFVGALLLALTRRDLSGGFPFKLAVAIAMMDLLWVVTTPLQILPMNGVGRTLFIAIGLVVALLAALQIKALLGIVRVRRAAPGGC